MSAPRGHPALDARLTALLALIRPDQVLLDIGCDHGHLALRAVVDGRVPHATLVDRAAPTLARARALLDAHDDGKVRGRVALRCVDGADLDRPVTGTVVIAGMGARAICRILERGVLPHVVDEVRLVLQPEVEVERLVNWLRARALCPMATTVTARGRAHAVVVADVGAAGAAEAVSTRSDLSPVGT